MGCSDDLCVCARVCKRARTVSAVLCFDVETRGASAELNLEDAPRGGALDVFVFSWMLLL